MGAARSEWSAEERQVRDAYGIALVLLLASTLGLIGAGSGLDSWFAAGAALLQAAALIVTLRVSGVRPHFSRLGTIAVAVVFAIGVTSVRVGGGPARVWGVTLWILLTVLTIGTVAKRLAGYHTVTIQLVMGLLVVYVLLGIGFGLSYVLIDLITHPSFSGDSLGVSGLLYFSFVTLATLGYGDISPLTSSARAFAVAEAVIGQLYLVSVVSMAVSRLGTRRADVPSRDAEPSRDAASMPAPDAPGTGAE